MVSFMIRVYLFYLGALLSIFCNGDRERQLNCPYNTNDDILIHMFICLYYEYN